MDESRRGVDGKHVLAAGWFGYSGASRENGYIRLLFSVNCCSVASAVLLPTETSDPVDVTVDT